MQPAMTSGLFALSTIAVIVSYWRIAALDVCDAMSAVGETQRCIPRRLCWSIHRNLLREHIPKKLGPDWIRAGHRFSEKIMLQR